MRSSGSGEEPFTTCALENAVVLAIDDGPANVLLLQRLLARAGVRHVEGVTDPRQAVEAFRRIEPDLVLLDLHMPHLDGLAVLDSIQSVVPADSFVPVIVLTADTTPESRNRALAAGAHDFLTKPFEHPEVLLRVNNLLKTRALHEQLRRHNQRLQEEIRRKEELEHQQAQLATERRRRMREVLARGELTMVYQPIIDLRSNQLTGFEALSRFTAEPYRPPNEWFAEAAEIGQGVDLELFAVNIAIAELDRIPPGVYLSVNVSPETALHPRLMDTIRPAAGRLVLELTEHAAVSEYGALSDRIGHLRELGARIAVDDAGSGYSSLQHILSIRPDIVKLDIALTRGIHSDPARRALAAALVQFGREIDAHITAEGIELAEELDALRDIGATNGQGYLLGRPAPLPGATSSGRPPAVTQPTQLQP